MQQATAVRVLHPAAMNAYQTAAMNTSANFSPEGFNLTRPKDDRIVEQEFSCANAQTWLEGVAGAGEEADGSLSYGEKSGRLSTKISSPSGKTEQKRRTTARNTIGFDGAYQSMGRAEEEGSPEWYVKKILDGSIAVKQLQSLSVSLRTQQIDWVIRFLQAQGQIALSNVLTKMNKRQHQNPSASSSDKDLDREYELIKCIKILMNNSYGADDALKHPQIIFSVAVSLTSPRLNTRRSVTEVLTFLCHWSNGQGHARVLEAFDLIKSAQNERGRFDAWMRMVEVTIDGRGKMGSLVGASDEVRSGGIGMESLLMEYAVVSLFLINEIIDKTDEDLQLRMHLRAQLTGCGIERIFTKMEDFQYETIDKQIEKYRQNQGIDYEDILERDGGSAKDGDDEDSKDLNDPAQIADVIMAKVNGSKAQDHFVSTMQHMLLLRDLTGEDKLRMFQLLDSMVTYVAMDRRLPDMDLRQGLNFTVQGLLDKLHIDAEARQSP